MSKNRSSRIDEQETDSNESDEFESSSEDDDETEREDGEAEIPINYGDNKQPSKRSALTSKTNQDNIEGGSAPS